MSKAVLGLLDDLLLDGLSGFRREIWRRRIEAKVYYELSLGLRDRKNERYWEFAIESLLRWPFCGKIVPPHRYLVFAHMLGTRLRNFSWRPRYWWPVRRCRENLTLSN
jgi:hypothetical protein